MPKKQSLPVKLPSPSSQTNGKATGVRQTVEMKKSNCKTGGGTAITQEKRGIAPAQPRPDEKSRTSPQHFQSPFHQSVASFSTFCVVRVLGDDLLSTKEREKGKLSRDRGINGIVGKCLWVYAAKALYCFSFGGYLCFDR